MKARGIPSKTMSDTEWNYDIHDKELWTIVQGFLDWKQYRRVSPRPVRVVSDYKNLVPLITTKEPSEGQARWMQELSQ